VSISPAFALPLMEAFPDTRIIISFFFPSFQPTSAFLPATTSQYQAACSCLNRPTWGMLKSVGYPVYVSRLPALFFSLFLSSPLFGLLTAYAAVC
jgi:hypothetical protein